MADRLPLLHAILVLPLLLALWGMFRQIGYDITGPLLVVLLYRAWVHK